MMITSCKQCIFFDTVNAGTKFERWQCCYLGSKYCGSDVDNSDKCVSELIKSHVVSMKEKYPKLTSNERENAARELVGLILKRRCE